MPSLCAAFANQIRQLNLLRPPRIGPSRAEIVVGGSTAFDGDGIGMGMYACIWLAGAGGNGSSGMVPG